MAIMKFFQWIFDKFFGAKTQPASTAEASTSLKAAGCPFSAMAGMIPNPHIGGTPETAATNKEVKQD